MYTVQSDGIQGMISLVHQGLKGSNHFDQNKKIHSITHYASKNKAEALGG